MLTITSIDNIKSNVLEKLGKLDPKLTYHRLEHTLDVLQQAERIALEEGGTNDQEMLLLKLAALYHDTGFLETYNNHEEKSCDIFLSDADDYSLSAHEKDIVVKLIMATKIPQQPKNHLEKILCDADLDYLGRNDFFSIGNALKNELMHFGVISGQEEWNRLQINFLSRHYYHTTASQRQREPVKKKNIEQLPT